MSTSDFKDSWTAAWYTTVGDVKAIANEQAIAVVDTKMDVLLESLGLGERAREALETRLTPDSEGTSSGEGQDSDDD